jgi:hypothetical protein
VLLKESLIDRCDAGEPIGDGSYASMMAYRDLFDALACADFELAHRFAMKIGGRTKLERRFDHPFTRDIGYALKYLVLLPNDQATNAINAFRTRCAGKGSGSYAGYATCMEGILNGSADLFAEGVREILRVHKRLSSTGHMFSLTPDEVICTWGLGLVNLGFSRGLSAHFESPFIPQALIFSAHQPSN